VAVEDDDPVDLSIDPAQTHAAILLHGLDFVRIAEQAAHVQVGHSFVEGADCFLLVGEHDLARLAHDSLVLRFLDGRPGAQKRPGHIVDQFRESGALLVDPPGDSAERGQQEKPADSPSAHRCGFPAELIRRPTVK